MSNRERLAQSTLAMTEEEAAFYLALVVKRMFDIVEEARDDAFCQAMEDAFEANSNKGELIDFEDACRMTGVNLG